VGLLPLVIKAIGNNEERKKSQQGTQDFNMENTLQQREVKPRAPVSKTSLYWEYLQTPWVAL
jgi:hypothetical protein